MWNEIQRIASLHLAETLRLTALPHDSALHLYITCKLLLSVRPGTSGDRRCGHHLGTRHSVLCFSHDACTAARVRTYGLYGYENKEFFHCRINIETVP